MNINFSNYNLEIFGSSHDEQIGVNIIGFPKGIKIDNTYIYEMLDRRRPGKSNITTTRNESDKPIIKSGIENNITTGETIKCIIKNTNRKSKDYSKLQYTPRPAHADLSAYYKYGGKLDMTGGGPFSGRLTAPMVFAGAIAKKQLEEKGVFIISHIKGIGNINDINLNHLKYDKIQQKTILKNKLPVIDKNIANEMIELINTVRKEKDSIGSLIETVIYNMIPGQGEHSDFSIESIMSKTIFCIPGVKGIEFGKGFELSKMRGSIANDEIYYDDNMNILTKTNNMGGILGGISNGMPITFNTVLKPTPSIAKVQKTINFKTKENVNIEITGRHDPCIGIRAVPVIEAMSALVIYDYILEMEKNEKSR